MSRRFGKVLSIVAFRVFLAICVAIAVGITNNFLINFSNSPDMKLIIAGDTSAIKPVNGKYPIELFLENRGATVASSRVKIKIPQELAGYVTIKDIEKQIPAGNAIVVEQGFSKDSESDKETVFKRDVEFRVFPSRNFDLGTVALDFSKYGEVRFDYTIAAESMVKRVGYYVFEVSEGKLGIKDFKQWADRSNMNATGWGRFFRYVSGKNIR